MDTENGIESRPGSKPLTDSEYRMKTFQVLLNLLCHIFVGVIVGVNIIFVFRLPLPLGNTPVHIVLCVLGYQLLMAEGILCLSPHNTWSTHLKLVDKKRVHWVLQVVGSVLAIAGSLVKIVDKANNPNTVNWDTAHGVTALVALIFTVVSLINGLTSLYAHECRRFIPSKLSKTTHICAGIITFIAANISLCIGFDKSMFRIWLGIPTSDQVILTLYAFIAIQTGIIVFAPLITFYQKFKTN